MSSVSPVPDLAVFDGSAQVGLLHRADQHVLVQHLHRQDGAQIERAGAFQNLKTDSEIQLIPVSIHVNVQLPNTVK